MSWAAPTLTAGIPAVKFSLSLSPSKDARGFLSLSTLDVLSSLESTGIFPLPLLIPVAQVEMFKMLPRFWKKWIKQKLEKDEDIQI